jgi:hypothetical protein
MFQFREEVAELLGACGWTPHRSVDVTQYTQRLLNEGFRFNSVSEEILRNLGGLRIVPVPDASNLFFPSEIFFDPYYAASGELDRVRNWQEKFDLELSPIGEYDPTYLLLCGTNGKIYSGRERRFQLLGDSIEEALEMRVLANRRPLLLSQARK